MVFGYTRPIPAEGWRYERTLRMFTFFSDNKVLLKAILDSDYKWLFVDRMAKDVARAYDHMSHFVNGAPMPVVKQRYYDSFLAYGFVSIILTWSRQGFAETPEQLYEMLLTALSTGEAEVRID